MANKEDWGRSDSDLFPKESYDNGNSYTGSYSLHEEAKQDGRGSGRNGLGMDESGRDESDAQSDRELLRSHQNSEKRYKKKRKKENTGKGIVIGILIVLIPLLLLTGAGLYVMNLTGSHLAVISSSHLDLAAIESKLSMIQNVIDSNFLFDYDEEKLEEKIYAGYVDGLGDPYTCYYTAEEYQEMMDSNEGTYYGIGVMISQNVKTGSVTVIRVFSGSPAEESGMKEGDIIMEVAGKEVTGIDLNEVVAAIKGAEGTTAEVKIYRESSQETLTLNVERRQVDVDTVYYRMLDHKIGYLELTEFDSVSTEQFRDALNDLKSQGMESMILDLRNNPGGLLDVAVDLADELIDTGTVVSMKDKNDKGEVYEATKEGALGLPLAVLVNGNSASASEVLSGCIRDYGVGTLVGEQTFGKGIVQHIIPFSDGTAMKITTAHYYTPKGDDIHGVGITPDVLVEDDKKTEDADEQLQAAIDLLTKER